MRNVAWINRNRDGKNVDVMSGNVETQAQHSGKGLLLVYFMVGGSVE